MATIERFDKEVKDEHEFAIMPDSYKAAVSKIVIRHAFNGAYGAQAFDEPSIALAKSPIDRWLACRLTMEEYGHHVHFSYLSARIGIYEENHFLHEGNRPLDLFEFEVTSWMDFVAIKMVVSLAKIIQFEDLRQSMFIPLRSLAEQIILPEEKFHLEFGIDQAMKLIQTAEGKRQLQESIHRLFPYTLGFFGGSASKNNEEYRKWGIKVRTNEEMRKEYVKRVKTLMDQVGLDMPEIPESYKYLDIE